MSLKDPKGVREYAQVLIGMANDIQYEWRISKPEFESEWTLWISEKPPRFDPNMEFRANPKTIEVRLVEFEKPNGKKTIIARVGHEPFPDYKFIRYVSDIVEIEANT